VGQQLRGFPAIAGPDTHSGATVAVFYRVPFRPAARYLFSKERRDFDRSYGQVQEKNINAGKILSSFWLTCREYLL